MPDDADGGRPGACPLCHPSLPFSRNPRATLVYACGHSVRSCCVVRIMRSTTGTVECPFCVDPRSVTGLHAAARGRDEDEARA